MEGYIRMYLYRKRRKGKIEGGSKEWLGERKLIEGWFKLKKKIRKKELEEKGGGVDKIEGEEEKEKFWEKGKMSFLIIVDDVENRRCLVV